MNPFSLESETFRILFEQHFAVVEKSAETAAQVEFITSVLAGSAEKKGLLEKADELVATMEDVYVRLEPAASMALEARDVPKRLFTAAQSKDFRDVLQTSMTEAGASAIQAVHQRAGELGVQIALEDLTERMTDALQQANVRVFGSESFADQFAVRKAAEAKVTALEAQLTAQVDQIKALKKAETERIAELAASEKARMTALAEAEKDRFGMATRYLAEAQGAAVKAATRRVIPALIFGVLVGVWASDQFLSNALYEIIFNETIPCAPVLR
jgi:hypothetical protein